MDYSELEIPENYLKSWQEIADLLVDLTDIKVALIMRIEKPHINVFISSNSEDNPYHPGDKEILEDSSLYCEWVIKTQNKIIVPDSLIDPEWENNPDVKLGMISYLGFPIIWPDKTPFGTICVLDKKFNSYSEKIERLMLKFRRLIELNLETIYKNFILGDMNRHLIDKLISNDYVTICAKCQSIKDENTNWHRIEEYFMKMQTEGFTHSVCPECAQKLYPEFYKKDK